MSLAPAPIGLSWKLQCPSTIAIGVVFEGRAVVTGEIVVGADPANATPSMAARTTFIAPPLVRAGGNPVSQERPAADPDRRAAFP